MKRLTVTDDEYDLIRTALEVYRSDYEGVRSPEGMRPGGVKSQAIGRLLEYMEAGQET